MKADINATFSALNSFFLDTSSMTINEAYLNHLLDIQCFNTDRNFYEDAKGKRIKSTALVWRNFVTLANECIRENEEPRREHFATNYHLKKWLDTYGRGYESIADTVKLVEDYRKNDCR